MNRRNIVSLSAVAALGLVLLPGSAQSQQKSLKDQLVGTWTLASWERTNPDGSKVHAFGTNPKGINMFSADGRFALIYMRSELPKLASNDRLQSTPQEAKSIVDGSIAYYGTYSVDEASKTITLNIESTTFPNQLGRPQKRVINSLTADELKYSNPTATAGGQIEITMKRAK
jgi:Lipocalin-like domain